MANCKIIVLLLLLFAQFCQVAGAADTAIIKTHLTILTKTEVARNHQNIIQLNNAADFIQSIFNKYSDSISLQEYAVNGAIYKNVICSFGTENTQRIIVGAHYDVCEKQQGADDNASGIAGLLELARLLQGKKLSYRIDLVAYTLEEPPYFRTEHMGSYVHAKSMFDQKADIYGMVSLEMIGYFSDEKGSQTYPIGILKAVYGNKGDYITLVKKSDAGKFAKEFCSRFKAAHTIKTKKFTGPPTLPGIDFSDHLNYWKFGYSALMVTDTSFYRNKNYHQPTDTMETLDLGRMAKVIDGVLAAITAL